MVVPARSSPRPQWAKTGSWRRYIKVSSRKLLQVEPPLTEQRSVKFNEDANARHEIPLTDYSQNELQWYKKSDYELFEKDRHLTALQYRTIKKKGGPFIEREHTVRGLEDLCEMDDSQRSQNPRADHLHRVLEEQTRQRKKGVYPNDTMMREISCKSSREARQRSAQLGEADALGGYVSSSRSLQRQVQGVMHNISRKIHK